MNVHVCRVVVKTSLLGDVAIWPLTPRHPPFRRLAIRPSLRQVTAGCRMIRLGSASYRTFQWRVRHSCLTAGAWKSQSHGHLSHNDEFHVGQRLPTGTATPVHERCEWREWATRRHKRGPLRQGHMWMCGRRDHGVRVGWHDLTDIAAAPFVVGASCDRDQPQQPSRGPEGGGGRGGGEGEGERYRDDAGVRWAPCLGSDCHTAFSPDGAARCVCISGAPTLG